MNIKQDNKLENFAVNDLNILSNSGKIPYNKRVSIERIKGCPKIRKKIFNINEKTKTLISIFNKTESITANLIFVNMPISSFINDIVSKRFPSSRKYLNMVG